MYTSSQFLSQDAKDLEFDFNKESTGKLEEEPRWKECLGFVSKMFPTAKGALYVRKYFNNNSKDIVKNMMDIIKSKYEVMLRLVKWMDEPTRLAALKKVKNMITNIAYPNELLDDKKLLDYYGPMKIDEDKFFESIFNIAFTTRQRGMKKLREPYVKSDWRNWFGAAVIDAFYDLTKNVISNYALDLILEF